MIEYALDALLMHTTRLTSSRVEQVAVGESGGISGVAEGRRRERMSEVSFSDVKIKLARALKRTVYTNEARYLRLSGKGGLKESDKEVSSREVPR